MRTGLCFSLAVLLLAAVSCGHKQTSDRRAKSDPQALRTCVDRWNQGNMVGWGPGPVNIAFRPYYRTKSGFGVGSRIPPGRYWHGFVWNAWVREKPCSCWVKVGRGPRSLPATGRNFLKPWFFIDVRRGHVSAFYWALKFVD